MRLFRHFDETPDAVRGGVAALGSFDGMHRGHRAVIEAARAAGDRLGIPWGLITFEPHPRAVLQPGLAPFRLTPLRAKARLLEEMGADFLLAQHFDRELAALGAEDFVTQVLAASLRAKHVVVGYDFVFGRGRKGDAAGLERLGKTHGFDVTCVAPALDEGGQPFSSTRIRAALVAGNPAVAARLLGRDWEIEGHVVHGDRRGRGLGYPTANIELGELLRPASGVYAVRAGIETDGVTRWHPGVAYCGPRPTFGAHEVRLEAHLFDFDGDLYGKHLRVALAAYLRGDIRFDSAEALAKQMANDDRAARRLLAQPAAEDARR